MPLLRFLVFFLIGVAVTIWCYSSGVAYRVPDWFGYGPLETVVTPGPAIVTTPGAPPIVTEGPTAVVTTSPAVGLAPPIDGDGIDDVPPDVYPANGDPVNGYPTNDYPPGDPAIVAKTDAVVANGSPLRVKIFRSETGFEARCTAYKIINRSQRVLSLSFDPQYGERQNVDRQRQETLLKPGETLAEDSFPVECVEFRSLFSDDPDRGPDYGPPGRHGHGHGFGGPIVKIEIEDCPQDNCAVAQF